MRILKQELYFPLIIGIHFVMWAIDLAMYEGAYVEVQADTFFGEYTNHEGIHPLRIVGEVFSSWVVTVFAFNFLMATRARWVERIFGGLDKMYLIHRRSGVIAVVLLLAHFITVPRDLTAFTLGKPLGFYAFLLIIIGVILAAAPPLKAKIRYNSWLRLHRFMGLFYVMGVAHALMVNNLIKELPLTRVYVFGMAALGIGSWVYRAFFYRRLHPELAYTLVSINKLDGRTAELRMKAQGEALMFEAGQFAFFRFPKLNRGEQHPFTIVSQPGDGELRIVIRALGDDTTDLQNSVNAGDAVMVEGPFGHFTLDKTRRRKRQVWIAGGIGITPFLALARALDDRDVRLVWCVPETSAAVFADELSELADSCENLTLTVWSSADRGKVSIDKLELTEPLECTFMICGPSGLKDAMIGQLLAHGVRRSAIHDEEFTFR